MLPFRLEAIARSPDIGHGGGSCLPGAEMAAPFGRGSVGHLRFSRGETCDLFWLRERFAESLNAGLLAQERDREACRLYHTG